MKRIACIACLLALLLSACSVEPQTPTTTERGPSEDSYQLTFTAEEISNDCVGDVWSFAYTCQVKLVGK